MIQGVEFKSLVTHPDTRGFFRELIRASDPFFQEGFAQWSHSLMAENVVKAWHFHHRQVDWWYVAIGELDVALWDLRSSSPTHRTLMQFRLKEAAPQILRIPPGVAHGCKVKSPQAHLFYITSRTYDPEDEGRYPFDTANIPHSWGDSAHLVVADRDRRVHIPPYPSPGTTPLSP